MGHSKPMVVRLGDPTLATRLANQIKKKALACRQKQNQRKITQIWVVKEEDHDVAMVWLDLGAPSIPVELQLAIKYLLMKQVLMVHLKDMSLQLQMMKPFQ